MKPIKAYKLIVCAYCSTFNDEINLLLNNSPEGWFLQGPTEILQINGTYYYKQVLVQYVDPSTAVGTIVEQPPQQPSKI